MKYAVMGMNDFISGSIVALGIAAIGALMLLGSLLWEIDHKLVEREEE